MSRPPRLDRPGSWHHVMNRGIARRSLFESKDDIRFFMAQLARAVRRGEIEVHAWCVLTTHFHLLARSPRGELSAAMRRAQNAYVRRFNRGRKRDGPLVRGRFRSKPVHSLAYRELLLRYIDANAVEAGLARSPCEYPWGSARAYATRDGPPWLSREWVEGLVCKRLRVPEYDAAFYAAAFLGGCPRSIVDLIELRIRTSSHLEHMDALDELVAAAPEGFARWLRARAELADASSPGLPVVDTLSVREGIRVARLTEPEWVFCLARKPRDGWEVLEVGLLRELVGAAFPEIGARLGRTVLAAARLYRTHRELLVSEPEYARRAAHHASRVLDDYRRLLGPVAAGKS